MVSPIQKINKALNEIEFVSARQNGYELSNVKEKENILYFGLLPVLSMSGVLVRVGADVMIGICWNAS